MSSFDKIVKLACKPKNAPPKPKYIDAIIAATWSEDGAVHDVCKALAPRFREPNSVVVFKALIVLHTMIRNGATDNVLSHLSQSDILKLRNVYSGNWEGFENPDHLHHYARYLDCRIRSFRDLKHDVIKVQSETNRDMRNSMTTLEEEQGYKTKKQGNNASLARSKTMMGRKLRSMTVEKGLLRETKVVHQMIDALVECRFYLDGVDDELRLTALRMLVKDLLILFQAGNEAVINLLEQYFEMSHIDAVEALSIYRHFCKQTEHVTEYLGVAKKLQNLLNVPIPNLRHAPLSLATALQEYLDDPNFEQNRLEYRANRAAADGKAVSKSSANKSKAASSPKPDTKSGASASTSNPAQSVASGPTSSVPQEQQKKTNIEDFFNSIEENQTSMFNQQAPSPNALTPQAAPNPFAQMMTGQPFAIPQINTQPTGFLMPQHTAMPNAANPFGIQGQQPSTAPGHRPFSTFLTTPEQQNFLQPQATGVNPFRQSMLMPQTTGMALFGVGSGSGMGMGSPQQQPNSNPFPGPNQSMQPMATGFGQSFFNATSPSQQPSQQPQQQLGQPFQPSPASTSMAPSTSAFATTAQTQTNLNVPQRPASTPLTTFGSTTKSASPPPAKPLKPHMTGTKNPFGPIIEPTPPVPKPPTLAELAMGLGSSPAGSTQQQPQANGAATNTNTNTGGFNFANSALNPGGTDMSSVASSFAFSNAKPNAAGGTASSPTATTAGSTFSDSLFSGSTNAGGSNVNPISATTSLPTGVGSGVGTSAGAGAGTTAPLKPQMTGFAGLKPFKPTSSFGAALMESLPSIPNSSGATSPTATTGSSAAGTGTSGASTIGPGTSAGGVGSSSFGMSEFGALNKQQQTGFGGSLGGLGALNAGANAAGNGGITGTSTPTTPANASSPRATSPTGLGATGTASRLGVGLRPQITGGGAANPFRASMAAGNTPGGGGFGPGVPNVPPLPTGFGSGSMFGTMPFSSSATTGMNRFGAFGQQGAAGQQPGGQQQSQGSASLI